MKKTPNRNDLNTLKSLVRTEIAKILKEEKGDAPQTPNEEPTDEKPKKDRGEVLQKVTIAFVKALKNNLQDVSPEELADSINAAMNHFQYGKDTKMGILRMLKNKLEG